MLIIHHHLLPSPRHSHTSSISSFWGLESWAEPQNKAEPGAVTEHETETRSAWGARDRESERAMVFLDVLVNYGCRRWLHKEDYTFE